MSTSEQIGMVSRRFFGHLLFLDNDCWFWRGCCDGGGYGILPTRKPWKENKAHRVAWRLFNGDIPDGMKVLHKCDAPRCVNPEHLFIGTQAENIADMCAKGRQRSKPQFGDDNPMSKLTRASVEAMKRCRIETGLSYRVIADRHGVTTMTAFRAITGRSWK